MDASSQPSGEHLDIVKDERYVFMLLEELKNYEWLERCTQVALESKSIIDMMQRIKDLFFERFEFDRFGILLGAFHHRYCVIHEVVTRNGLQALPSGSLMIVKNTGLEWVYQQKKLHYNPDLMENQQFIEDETMYKLGLRSMVRIPLMFQQEVFGVMTLKIQYPNFYSPTELTLMNKVAQRLSGILYSAQLYYQIRRQAYTDALTGCYNRHFLTELETYTTQPLNSNEITDYLEEKVGVVFPPSEKLSLLFIDVDRFKDYNDRFGHAAGDELLRHLISAVNHWLADRGFTIRFGGDEFLVLLPGLNLEDVLDDISRLQENINNIRCIPDLPLHAQQTSLSIGGTEGEWMRLKDLVNKADQHMYEQKKISHRNFRDENMDVNWESL